MGILSFLFGKEPKITFTREGRTVHELEPKKWEAWNDRFRKNPNYDFHQHSGTKGVIDMSKPPLKPSPKSEQKLDQKLGQKTDQISGGKVVENSKK